MGDQGWSSQGQGGAQPPPQQGGPPPGPPGGPPPGPGGPPPGQPGAAQGNTSNGAAIGALVLGLLALLFGLLLGWIPILGIAFVGLGVILGLIAVILGFIGRGKPTGGGQAMTGIITGAIGIVASIGWTVAWIAGIGAMEGEFDDLEQEFQDEVEQELDDFD